MTKRKILFVRLGHFSFTNRSLLAQIRKRYPDHEIIDFDVKAAIKKRPLEVLIGLTVEAVHYGIGVLFDAGERHGYFFKNPYVFERISSHFREQFAPLRDEIDLVVQTQGLFNAALPGVPLLVYTDYTLRSVRFTETHFPERFQAQEVELYHRADAIAVSASHAKATLVQDYGCAPDKVHVVYIGSNIESDFENFSLARYAAQKICFVGIEWDRKGGEYLVEAFLQLTEQFPDASLTIVGCTPAVSHPKIRTTGKISPDEVKEILKESSIFCLPSIVEPSSVAVIEAATYGLPVVGTLTGGFPDAIEDGVSGLLVPIRDSRSLAGALGALLADPQRALEMGRAARKRARETFNWDIVGAKLVPVIDSLMSSARP